MKQSVIIRGQKRDRRHVADKDARYCSISVSSVSLLLLLQIIFV